MTKTPKKPAAPKKRGRGRPRKDPGGRLFAAAWLPAELLRQLDAYVAELQKAAPGASRGDVITEALRTHRPFRLWLLKASSRVLINRFGKPRLAEGGGDRRMDPLRISLACGGLFSGADGPVTFQVPGNLYFNAKCDVLVGRVNNTSGLVDGVIVADCRINASALPDRLEARALENDFQIEESSRPGAGAAPDQRSFFLSRKPAAKRTAR